LKTDKALQDEPIVSREDTSAKTSPELADELRDAPLASLKGRTTSAAATALVLHLAVEYPRTSSKDGVSYKPQKLLPQVHAAIGAVLADLLMAQADEDGAGWLRLSLDKKAFKKPSPVSYRMFDGLRSSWKAGKLIAEHTGYPGQFGFGNPGPRVGKMTRFRATPKLLKIAEDHGVLLSEVQTASVKTPTKAAALERLRPLGFAWAARLSGTSVVAVSRGRCRCPFGLTGGLGNGRSALYATCRRVCDLVVIEGKADVALTSLKRRE
jgi:hypothetical protein